MGNSFVHLGCSPEGESLLQAARDGDVSAASLILSRRPQLAKFLSFGLKVSPLHLAASRGHPEIVSSLLAHGAYVDVRNHSGQTPLMQACYHGHYPAVFLLLLKGADVTMADSTMSRLPIHFAASGGYTECARLLLADRSANEDSPEPNMDVQQHVNVRAECCLTPLHLAAINGHASMCHLLLELGALVDATSGHDGLDFDIVGLGYGIGGASTPLHYAARSGNLDTITVLLSYGASRRYRNHNGWTAQYVARLWKKEYLEHVLDPDASIELPSLPPIRLLAQPTQAPTKIYALEGLLKIQSAQEGKSAAHKASTETCGICLDRPTEVVSTGCTHQLCIVCALKLCSTTKDPNTYNAPTDTPDVPEGSVPCPFCRAGIVEFVCLSDGSTSSL